MYWKGWLVVLLLFFCNLSFAFAEESQVVTPIIKNYTKSIKNRINLKTKTHYSNSEADIGKKQDQLYYGGINNEKKIGSQTQTSNPYFTRVDVIRESNSNMSNSNVANIVANNIEKEKKQESQAEKNQQKYNDYDKSSSGFFSDSIKAVSGFGTSTKSAILSTPDFLKGFLTPAGDAEVASRPGGFYKGFMVSFMVAGSTNISGNEQSPSGVASNPWRTNDTFTTSKVYLPSAELGIFLGSHLGQYFRTQLDFTWTYMYGNVGSVITNKAAYPNSNFILPNDTYDGHLFAMTYNVFLDPYRNLKIWPTVGFGAGAAMFLFSNYNDMAFVYPVLNFYLGFNYMLPDKKYIVSLGYKLQYILTGYSDNQNPVQDLNKSVTNTRPVDGNQSIFEGIFIHKLELTIRMY